MMTPDFFIAVAEGFVWGKARSFCTNLTPCVYPARKNPRSDYEDLFCPPSTRKSRRECVDRPSREDGTLAARFERFVRAWDGRDAYNIQ